VIINNIDWRYISTGKAKTYAGTVEGATEPAYKLVKQYGNPDGENLVELLIDGKYIEDYETITKAKKAAEEHQETL